MAFVNEYISDEDVEKYGIRQLRDELHANYATREHWEWTRDRERESQHCFPGAAPQRRLCKKRLSCAERRAACPQKAKETKALPLYESARTDHLGR